MITIQKQVRRYYLFTFCSCLRITDAVWVVYLLSRGYSLWQVGLAETVFHIVSLCCEIPSGMVADLLGRRYSLVAAGVLSALSNLLMMNAERGYLLVVAGMAFSALGVNFMSGTDSALLYDSLKQAGCEEEYLRCESNTAILQSLGFGGGCLCSFVAAWLGYFPLYVLSVSICCLMVAVALSLQEPVATETQAARVGNPLAGLGGRFAAHVRQTVDFLRRNPWVDCKLLAWAGMDLPLYLTCMFLQQHLTELGVPLAFLGLPLLVVRYADIPGNLFSRRCSPPMSALFTGCCLLIGFGTFCAGVPIVWVAVGGAVLANMASGAWQLRIDANVNGDFPSDQRATLLSVANMLYSVLMIACSPLVGAIGDVTGHAGNGLSVLGLCLMAAAPVCLVAGREVRTLCEKRKAAQSENPKANITE